MNRLASETSPYLLQHANNPVDWYPWGDEALGRARREDKPILLSIGYAACHWCHVMEHESFENPAIAAVMNEHFVNIKVDREERPDLDSIYMQAVQAMTGHGGWPMTMFLTPEGEPFYGGTYFPPADRHGLPGFPRVLRALADAWVNDRAGIARTGARVREIYEVGAHASAGGDVTLSTLERASRTLAQQFDETHGGFGAAPKFPPCMSLEFLLTHWARTGQEPALDMVHRTFVAMSRGGIADHIGGGIHRYSVDERWLVPHFEKMLYDNALFIRLGVHVWQATGDNEVRRATTAAIRWVAREMTSPEGGFFSSLDADSEGHEGKFYVWSDAELDRLLGEDAAVARAAWGVSREGNFEGHNILWLPSGVADVARRLDLDRADVEAALERARDTLYRARALRIWPALDDKVLASWNGLMLRALIEAARAFDDADMWELARRNARFVADALTSGGRVHRSWRRGRRLDAGFLEDHAAVALAFLQLFSDSGEGEWIDRTRAIAAHIVSSFRDEGTGFFFDTPAEHEALITRPRDITDNAVPSGTSLTAELLLRLGVIDNNAAYRAMGEELVRAPGESLGRAPQAFGHLLVAADLVVHGAVEVVVPQGAAQLRRCLSDRFIPSLVTGCDPELTAFTQGKLEPGERRGFVCRRYVCEAPTDDPSVFAELLRGAARRG